VLQTTHFCSLCIACKDIPRCLRKTNFCITAVLPNSILPVGKKKEVFFFITFYNLATCLTKVDKLIAEKELEDYLIVKEKFHFESSRKPALEIVVIQPKNGRVGVLGKTRVLRDQVDFFVRERMSEKDLQEEECKDFYPPRFRVFLFLSSTQKNATLNDAKIKFRGAIEDPEFDICLDLPDSETIPNGGCTPLPVTSTQDVIGNDSLGRCDLLQVKSKLLGVATKWMDIGLALGLSKDRLDVIKTDHTTTEDRLTAMASKWLNRTYDVSEHREPSWETLSEAVRSPAGGNNPVLADMILNEA
jgi:hypothetical protein